MRTDGVIEAVDLHVAGAPVRLVTGGVPRLPDVRARLGRRLLAEPWGHAAMRGAFVDAGPAGPALTPLDADALGPLDGRVVLAAASWLWRSGQAGGAPGGDGWQAIDLETPDGGVRATLRADGDRSPAVRVGADRPRLEAPGLAGGPEGPVDLFQTAGLRVAIARLDAPVGLDPGRMLAASAAIAALAHALARDGVAAPDGWLACARPGGAAGMLEALYWDRDGTLDRLAPFGALAALAAAGGARGGRAPAPIEVCGPAGIPVRVVPAGDGAFAVEARAFVVAWRRFFADADDAIEPFVVA